MAFYLPPIKRRTFLWQALCLAAVGCQGARPGRRGQKGLEPDSWALLSDTHVAADPAQMKNDVRMALNLERASREVMAWPQRPEAVLVNGDCALQNGQPGDYRTMLASLEPLRSLPLYLALGNHDDRENFLKGLPVNPPSVGEPVGRHVGMIRGRFVRILLLDSLEATNSTPGLLGSEQLAWLEKQLQAEQGTPTVVVGHHNIEPGQVVPAEVKMGLRDSQPFREMLEAHRQVKAYIYGHTHTWKTETTAAGLHLINLPPVAYVFEKGRPNGWVHALFDARGVRLELRSLNPQHPQHGQVVTLPWRPA